MNLSKIVGADSISALPVSVLNMEKTNYMANLNFKSNSTLAEISTGQKWMLPLQQQRR